LGLSVAKIVDVPADKLIWSHIASQLVVQGVFLFVDNSNVAVIIATSS
jgi:hypothetical protein